MTDADSRQAGAEVEVTPAMIEAGVTALSNFVDEQEAFGVVGSESAVEAVIVAALSAQTASL
jgi:hypothetical protein